MFNIKNENVTLRTIIGKLCPYNIQTFMFYNTF